MTGRAQSFVEAIRSRGLDRPDSPLYTFLANGELPAESMTFAELDADARRLAAWFQNEGLAGERVLLLFPPGLEFIRAFLGCLYAGVVAVPAYPPRGGRSNPRLEAIVESARPRWALSTESLLRRGAKDDSALGALPWRATDGEVPARPEDWREPRMGPDTLAFLQYTSGSTAAPKGVRVCHGNLLHNEEMIRRAFGQSESSVVVSWLPLYHDMGLIGGVLQPLYLGARCILMSPVAVLQRPARWLEAVTRYRATTSGAPNFAYDLCVQRISPEDREPLDLSSWHVAFNGAEPIRAETLESFVEAFEPCGFRRTALYPCYGLAEATLLVTGGSTEESPVLHAVAPTDLEQGRVVAASREAARRLVGCGRGWMEQDVLVVDPETRQPVPEGRVGEIWVAGPSVADGYWGLAEKTKETFGATLADGRGPWLRTGDLGFLDGHELFVTGRRKDLIIVRGRNLYPQDLEHTAEASHPELRPAGGAAFAVEVEGEERVVLVHEIERRARAEPGSVADAVIAAVTEEHGVRPHEVVLIRAGALPRTSSGKVRRTACRERYLEGTLRVVGTSGVQAPREESAAWSGDFRDELDGASPMRRRERLEAWLVDEVSHKTRMPPERVRWDVSPVALGLDSLAAAELTTALETATGIDLPLSDVLDVESLAELRDRLLARLEDSDRVEEGSPGRPILEKRVLPSDGPLSPGQKGLWWFQRLEPESAAYHIAAAAQVEGPLDDEALARALDALVERHGALRTTFHADDSGEPFRRVSPEASLDWACEDATDWTREHVRDTLEAEAFRPFDLETGPLLRIRVLMRGPRRAVWLLAVHHLVADYASLAVLWRDLERLYLRETTGQAESLPRLPYSYGDFVSWQRRWMQGPEHERAWRFWRDRLQGVPASVDLPTDRPRPVRPTYRGGRRTAFWNRSKLEGLRSLGREAEATLFVTVLALFQAWLTRMSGQSSGTVGSPTAGRDVEGLEDLVGYFVNPVALPWDAAGRPTVREFLGRTRATVLEAFDHRDLPFPVLAERLEPDREPGRNPLFQVMLVLQTVRPGTQAPAAFAVGDATTSLSWAGLELEPVSLEPPAVAFDLLVTMAEVGDGLAVSLQYNADLFDVTTAERWVRHLEVLVDHATASPEAFLGRLELLTAPERHQTLLGWNDTASGRSRGQGLFDRFLEQARRTPDATAVRWREERWTYGELASRSLRVAARLRRLGVGPEARVGVLLDRRPELLAAIFGVLAAGGAYVPLDPAYPLERRKFMLRDAGCAALLVGSSESSPQMEGFDAPVVTVTEIMTDGQALDGPVAVEPRNLAYLIYTSGSTGRPKGVAITQDNALGLVDWSVELFSEADLTGVLAATSICFDLSIFELFVTLCRGGAVVLVDDVLAVAESPNARHLTLINTVPSALSELLAIGGIPSSVHTVNLAGEPLSRELAEAIYRHSSVRRVLDLYGPSEDTTYSTGGRAIPGASGSPTVGRPVSDTRLYLLDSEMEPVPSGAVGEIWLGGAGTARGYFGRPGRTAEGFRPDPISELVGGRLYRTGDLARYRTNGDVDFLGRLDHQVKVRGFRIELGEVEAALLEHEAVEEVVVTARGQGAERRLVAYWTPARELEPNRELVSFLKQRLPAFMVPQTFIQLDALPRLPNGKIDRKALPEPRRQASGGSAELPRTPTEELVARWFEEVLERDNVPRDVSFFELGGHSLLLTRVAARAGASLRVDVSLRELFEAPTVAEIGALIDQARRSSVPAAPPLEPAESTGGSESWPLSFAQERLWFLDRLEPASPLYNVPVGLRVEGALSVAALEQALGEVVRCQEALRTVFPEREDGPRAVVEPPGPLPWSRVDLTHLEEGAARAQSHRLAREASRRPFALDRGPLLRAILVRRGPVEHEALVTLHHIVSDGWSLGVLVEQLKTLYENFRLGVAGGLDPLPIQYVDYAVWERSWLSGEALDALLEFWRDCLAEAPEMLPLPTDRPRPPVAGVEGGQVGFEVSPDRLAGLEGVSNGATRFMLLLAAFTAFLGRITGRTDLVVGSPVAHRNHPAVESLVGFFVNTLALRVDLTGDPTFEEVVHRVRDVALDAFAHQDLPFERLVREVSPERALSSTPLFQVLFVLQNAPLGELELPGVELTRLPVHAGTAPFELTLELAEEPGGKLAGRLEYRRDLFDRTTILRWARSFSVLLDGIAAEPSRCWSDLSLFAASEHHQVIREYNDTPDRLPEVDSLDDFVLQSGRRAPDRVAFVFGDLHMTYRCLLRESAVLARRLLDSGAGHGEPVGLSLERGPDLMVATLAILRAGSPVLPLDAAYPEERLTFMARDAGVRSLITAKEVAAARAERAGEDGVDGALPELPRFPESLVYLVYTSGSTGRPKGVEMPHHALTHLLAWQRSDVARRGPVRTLQFTPASFDVFFQETFFTWAEGGTLVGVDEDRRRDPAALWKLLARERVERLFLPFVALQQLAEISAERDGVPAKASALIEVVTAGEQLQASPAVRKLFHDRPDAVLHNQYGPSESHVVTSHTLGPAPDAWSGLPPIGRPTTHSTLVLVEAGGRPAPLGVAGEMMLGGSCLARGYHGRPAATARRFVPDGLTGSSGERLYRTGDLGRQRADGVVEFLGRLDFQVKIRGFRVEPGEVEAVLATHPEIREAVVVARDDLPGGTGLVAYVVSEAAEGPEPAELAEFLADRLPAYMVPRVWELLDSLPLTPSGKVSRRDLPEPNLAALERLGDTAPRSPTEELLADLWMDLLGVPRVGRDDDFFDLGGHSLLAARVLSRIRSRFGVELSLRSFFQRPTLAAQARAVEAARGQAPWAPIQRVPRTGDLPLSFAQERLWLLHRLEPEGAAYNMSAAVILRGRLSVSALIAGFGRAMRRQEVLRVVYPMVEGRPVVRARPPELPRIPRVDLSALEPDRRRAEAEDLEAREAAVPFDLAGDSVLRLRLVRLTAEEHRLLLTVHHVAADGWSIGVLVREVGEGYATARSGVVDDAPELPVQYADFAAWQRRRLDVGGDDERLEYWRSQLADAPAFLDLPTDRPRPRIQTFRGDRRSLWLPSRSYARLQELGRNQGTTLFMTLLAVVSVLLGRWAGVQDLCIGSPVAGRERSETEDLVGVFLNNLVLRVDLSGRPTFRELLGRVRDMVLDAWAHRDVPFEALLEDLLPTRDLARTPWFQVMLNLLNFPREEIRLPDLEVELRPPRELAAKFDWTFYVEERDGGLAWDLVYNAELFDARRIEIALEQLRGLLEACVETPDVPVDSVPLAAPGIASELPDLSRALEREAGSPVHRRFLRRAEETPDAPVLLDGHGTWTYAELSKASGGVARALVERGVEPGQVVAVHGERSSGLVAAVLGILRAGAAFSILDPEDPPGRRRLLLEQAVPRLRIHLGTDPSEDLAGAPGEVVRWPDRIADMPADDMEAPADWARLPEALPAYVAFTSGTTGRPKGIVGLHGPLTHFLSWHARTFRLGPEDRFALISGLSHDPLLRDLFTPLALGASLAVPTPETKADPTALRRFLGDAGVTVIHLTPSLGRWLHLGRKSEEPVLSRLRWAFFGGDVLPGRSVDDFASLSPEAEVVSFYGATETPQAMAWYRPDPDLRGDGTMPVGRGIEGAQVLVLNREDLPAGVGELGQICVRTPWLSQGYLRDAALTADRFRPDPGEGSPGARIYRTGDLGRYLPTGDVSFEGRTDRQLKLRGFRVEPGEVESALESHPSVLQAHVDLRGDTLETRRLVAWVVVEEEDAWLEESVREHVRERLPAALLPSALLPLESLPLTSRGKVDERALPEPGEVAERVFMAPGDPLEEAVADLWRRLLPVERIGIRDDFFELGGNSLLGAELTTRLTEAFGVEVGLRDLFEAPTVADLARLVAERTRRGDRAAASLPMAVPEPESRFEPFPLTDLQQAYWVGRRGDVELGNIASHRYLELEGEDLALDRFEAAWRRLILRHDMLRAVVLPDGRQRILPEVPPYEIECADLTDHSPGAARRELESIRQEMSHRLQPADRWPLFEIRASRVPDGSTRIHLSFDYLIADARSFLILGGELAQLYHEPESELPALELTFRDCVLAEEKLRESEVYRRSLEYWRDRIPSLPAAPALPLVCDPAEIAEPRFERRSAALPPALWQRLRERATRAGLTPSGVLLAAYAQTLAAWSAEPRFSLVLTLFHRLPIHPQINRVVGDFTSTTVLAVDAREGDDFATFASHLQEHVWERLDHRWVSGVTVLRELVRMTGGARSTTVPVVFTSLLEQGSGDTVRSLETLGRFVYSISQTPQVFLDHQVYEEDGALVFNWDAIAELFPPGVLDDLFQAYCHLLGQLATEEDAWQRWPSLTPQEQLALRAEINRSTGQSAGGLLHEPFLQWAAQDPHRLAVRAGDVTVDYGALDRASGRLGRRLESAGVSPGELVAVCMSKGWEQVAAVLGIVRAGAAYLPIDPELPAERIEHLLEVGDVRFALTRPLQAEAPSELGGVERIEVEPGLLRAEGPVQAPKPAMSQDDLAYVIFTSGSTGRPKGVVIDHRGALNTVLDVNRRFGIGPEDRVLGLSSLSFDLSVYDVFGTLAAGGAIVLPEPDGLRDPAHWRELIQREGVTLWNSVPALMEMLVEHVASLPGAPLENLRQVWLSGDWIPLSLPDRIRGAAPRARVVSLGGATEASIWSIFHPVGEIDPSWPSIPYGRPLAHQTFHVLDARLEPRPVWVPGELYIGGRGVARGYWRDPERTGASFLKHPKTGERLYRTGDLGRYRPGGDIEFLGRVDFQVKVQGYRIELGEIESVLSRHPDVRAAVASALGERMGSKQLVAWFVPATDPGPEAEELARYLEGVLPAYMVPAAFVRLDELPLTANGKVDRSALPTPGEGVVGDADEPPEGPLEEALAELWQELLDLVPGRVGRHRSFFELGGDSLLATRLAAMVRERFGVEVSLRTFFEAPTVAALAERLDAERDASEHGGPEEDVDRITALMAEIGDLPPEQVEVMIAELETEESSE